MANKTIIQIAQSCDVRYNDIYQVIKKERIIGTHKNNKRVFDEYQQDLIYQNIYYEGKSDCLIFESKINSM